MSTMSQSDRMAPSTARSALLLSSCDVPSAPPRAAVDAVHQVEAQPLVAAGLVQRGDQRPGLRGVRLDRLARFRMNAAQDHAAVLSLTCRWVRPSSPVIPRIRSGLTASVSPSVSG